MKVLLVNGPNLNRLGQRDPAQYGTTTLADIEERVHSRAAELGADVLPYQSNSEGTLVDFLQREGPTADGIIINAGALTHYGYSLRDCLEDLHLTTVEVHISHIHAREEWRRHSVLAPVCTAQITGMGWRGYLAALEYLVARYQEEHQS